MSNSRRILSTVLIISIVLMSLSSVSCGVYRRTDLQETGNYATLNQEKIREAYLLQVINSPSLENTILELELSKYPVYREYRKIEYRGKKQDMSPLLIGLGLTAGGLWLAYDADIEQGKDSTKLAIGAAMFICGLVGIGLQKEAKWHTVYKYAFKNEITENKSQTEPVPYTTVLAYEQSTSKNWKLSTDKQGRFSLDVEELALAARRSDSIRLRFEVPFNNTATFEYTVSSSLISDLRIPLTFTVRSDIIPKEVIRLPLNRKRNFVLEITPYNRSSVDAHNITIKVNASKGIILNESFQVVPKIAARSEGESLYFPFSLTRELPSTKLRFTVSFGRKNIPFTSKEVYIDLGN